MCVHNQFFVDVDESFSQPNDQQTADGCPVVTPSTHLHNILLSYTDYGNHQKSFAPVGNHDDNNADASAGGDGVSAWMIKFYFISFQSFLHHQLLLMRLLFLLLLTNTSSSSRSNKSDVTLRFSDFLKKRRRRRKAERSREEENDDEKHEICRLSNFNAVKHPNNDGSIAAVPKQHCRIVTMCRFLLLFMLLSLSPSNLSVVHAVAPVSFKVDPGRELFVPESTPVGTIIGTVYFDDFSFGGGGGGGDNNNNDNTVAAFSIDATDTDSQVAGEYFDVTSVSNGGGGQQRGYITVKKQARAVEHPSSGRSREPSFKLNIIGQQPNGIVYKQVLHIHILASPGSSINSINSNNTNILPPLLPGVSSPSVGVFPPNFNAPPLSFGGGGDSSSGLPSWLGTNHRHHHNAGSNVDGALIMPPRAPDVLPPGVAPQYNNSKGGDRRRHKNKSNSMQNLLPPPPPLPTQQQHEFDNPKTDADDTSTTTSQSINSSTVSSVTTKNDNNSTLSNRNNNNNNSSPSSPPIIEVPGSVASSSTADLTSTNSNSTGQRKDVGADRYSGGSSSNNNTNNGGGGVKLTIELVFGTIAAVAALAVGIWLALYLRRRHKDDDEFRGGKKKPLFGSAQYSRNGGSRHHQQKDKVELGAVPSAPDNNDDNVPVTPHSISSDAGLIPHSSFNGSHAALTPMSSVATSSASAGCRWMYKKEIATGLPVRRVADEVSLDDASRLNYQNFRMNDSHWEIPRNALRFTGKLGEGCFGHVLKAEITGLFGPRLTSIVAVKQLKNNNNNNTLMQNIIDRSMYEDFDAELGVMQLFDPHPNVITLLGCDKLHPPWMIIMEYAVHGKLLKLLRISRGGNYYGLNSLTTNTNVETATVPYGGTSSSAAVAAADLIQAPTVIETDNVLPQNLAFSYQNLVSFCLQIAKGMQYLSSIEVVHRDLAARNVLVGEGFVCKLSDFGLARKLDACGIYEPLTNRKLPIRWMAPESLKNKHVFSHKSDVYAFGVVMWEIATLGATPYYEKKMFEIVSRVTEGQHLEQPERCTDQLYDIMKQCWQLEPVARPTFAELVGKLEQLLLTNLDYLVLDETQSPPTDYYNVAPDETKYEEKL